MSRWTKGLLIAIASAFCFGVPPIFIKSGVARLSPHLGAGISLPTGAFFHVIFALSRGYLKPGPGMNNKGVIFMALAGASNVAAVNLYYLSIGLIGISLAVPLAFSHPLFAVLFARAFMQKSEAVTVRVALGAFLVVVGMVLIIIS